MRDVFLKKLTSYAKLDPMIFLITADLGFGVLDEFRRECPKQFLNIGIAEQNMIGVATGLALEGRTVFVYSIGNFPTLRCIEQIRNDACYHDANVKIISVGAGFSYGQLGMSHHSTEDISMLTSLPMAVFSPGDLWEAENMPEVMLENHGACYIRLDKSEARSTNSLSDKFRCGRIREIKKGSDFALIATGGILELAIQAAEILKKDGVSCRVLSAHTLKPIDKDAIVKAAQETAGLLTIEEHVVNGGLGGIVAEVLMDSGVYPKQFYRIGLRGGFSSIVGSQDYLRSYYHMGVSSIVSKIRAWRANNLSGHRALTL